MMYENIETLIELWNMPNGEDELSRDAAADVAALRLRAAESDALRAERDELKAKANVSICAWCGQECPKEPSAVAEHVLTCEKRPEETLFRQINKMSAELDALRATVAEQAKVIALNKYVTPPFDLCDDDTVELALECVKKDETIAKQAQTIETARRALLAWYVVESNECGEDIFPTMKELGEVDLYESGDDLLIWAHELRRAWLAANAPTPTPGETESEA